MRRSPAVGGADSISTEKPAGTFLRSNEVQGSHPIMHRVVEELRKIVGGLENLEQLQRKKARETPDTFTTVQGIAVPDPSLGTPVQVAGAQPRRYAVTIQNTGTKSVFIGNSPRNALVGYTLVSLASVTLRSRDTVFVYAPSASASTVDVLEELYGETSRPIFPEGR